MTVAHISPRDTVTQLEEGKAVLIDIRTAGEVQQSYVPNSIFIPHEILTRERLEDIGVADKHLVLLCHSGGRAENTAKRISQELGRVSVLKGGIELWKKEGFDVARTCNATMPMERQVLITAGGMVLISLGLAAISTPKFLWWTAFMGAGMMFAGITGFCGMAKLLGLLPWNKAKSPECCVK